MNALEILQGREYLAEHEVAALLGLEPTTLRSYRGQKRGPTLRYKKSRARVLYLSEDVRAELARRHGLTDNVVRLDTATVAKRLNVSESCLRVWRTRGETDLPWERDGRRVWYKACDVEAYQRRQQVAKYPWQLPRRSAVV